MIPRYCLPEMSQLWTEEKKYQTWLDVEMAAARAMAQAGIVDAGLVNALEAKLPLPLNPRRIEAIEQVTRHDVIAFLTHVEELAGPPARILHYGLTSYDIVDTALNLRLKAAGSLILAKLERLLSVLRQQALTHKHRAMVGRSHGIHAEPLTFGVVLARWYAGFDRSRERFRRAVEDMSTGKLSGAVGVYGTVPPAVEEAAMASLGLRPETVSSQIVPRDRHAVYFNELALMGALMEDVAVNLRHLQRTEVHEVEEAFAKGQKGSSAMPHKKNPISGENITGMARLLRSYAQAAMEDVVQWHERDIAHSSVERLIAPDATTVAHYTLDRLTRLVERLSVFEQAMDEHLDLLKGLIFSEKVLLALVGAGLARQEAYVLVQRNAMKTWDTGVAFKDNLAADPEVTALVPAETLALLFDREHHLRHVDAIFQRVFGE